MDELWTMVVLIIDARNNTYLESENTSLKKFGEMCWS